MRARVLTLVLAPLLLALLATPGGALAADELWVESAPLASRDQAEGLAADLPLQDDAATVRVLRRFVKGAGWRYVVRVDGVGDVEGGRVVAAALAGSGARALVMERDGSELRTLVDTGNPTTAAAADAEGGAGDRARLPEARAVLRDAVKAHGGERGGLELVELAGSLSFAFERTVAIDQGEMLAANRYHRQGEALRLEIEILDGVGTDSTTVVTAGNQAWVLAGGEGQAEGEPVGRDVARTREVLARFAPEAVLSIPLGLARDVEDAAAWQDVKVTQREELAGRPQHRVVPADGQAGVEGLVAAWFDVEEGTLTRVQWRSPSGELTFSFDDYREVVPGLVVPFATAIERNGRPVERVRVLQLALDPPLEASLFEAP